MEFKVQDRRLAKHEQFLGIPTPPPPQLADAADRRIALQFAALPLTQVRSVQLLSFLGAAFFGRVEKCSGVGGICASKTPRPDCILGGRRATEVLLQDAAHAARIGRHPCLIGALAWCWQGGQLWVLLELCPPEWTPMVSVAQQQHFADASVPCLYHSLGYLADVLLYLNSHNFPLLWGSSAMLKVQTPAVGRGLPVRTPWTGTAS